MTLRPGLSLDFLKKFMFNLVSRNRLLLNQLIICDQVDKYLEIYVYPTMVGGGVNFMD
jgi:hypothetical protein